MRMRLRPATPDDLRRLRIRSLGAELTYAPVGLTSTPETPDGFRRERWQRPLGHGRETFDLAARAIQNWQVQRGSGLIVLGDSPQQTGDVVAMSATLPIGFIDLACRVVDVIDEAGRSGFVYGTLPGHPERGEESFVVEIDDADVVTFEIVAVSKAAHPLARLVSPVARRLQSQAAERYLDAITDVIDSG